MKLITYIILALIAIIYFLESPLWASACQLKQPKTAIFDIQEGVIVENPNQADPFEDDLHEKDYETYHDEEDIG